MPLPEALQFVSIGGASCTLEATPGDHECAVPSCRQPCQAHLLLRAAAPPLQEQHRLRSLPPSSNSSNRISVVTPSDHAPAFQGCPPISDKPRLHPPQISPSLGVIKLLLNLAASPSPTPGRCSLHPPPPIQAESGTLRISSKFFQGSGGSDKLRPGKCSAFAGAGEVRWAQVAWPEGQAASLSVPL